jgi:uncharacterized membrane-anchored protein YitT (DUF2179 family)
MMPAMEQLKPLQVTMIRYCSVIAGCIFIACAINLFFVPHHLLSNGLSGVAIIFHYLLGWPIGVQMLVMNLPLLYVAYRLIGKVYAIETVFGAIVLSCAVDGTRFLSNMTPVSDPALSAITGGIIAGVGAGLIFRVNASVGGLDIIATVIKKYYSFNVGMVGFVINCLITFIAATIFGIQIAILTLIAMFTGAKITDQVVEGVNRKKSIYIVSYRPEEIVAAILKEVGRGATILYGEGAYTRQDKRIIFVVVSLTQISHIKHLVEQADPDAFMLVNDAVEVLGKGFTQPKA